ncbi:unnamed protein product, partial [Arabidopsis halleri]
FFPKSQRKKKKRVKQWSVNKLNFETTTQRDESVISPTTINPY